MSKNCLKKIEKYLNHLFAYDLKILFSSLKCLKFIFKLKRFYKKEEIISVKIKTKTLLNFNFFIIFFKKYIQRQKSDYLFNDNILLPVIGI